MYLKVKNIENIKEIKNNFEEKILDLTQNEIGYLIWVF